MRADSDVDLLVRLQDGDERALAALYDRHGVSLYGLARSILADPADAEEVVEDVFVRLWEAPDGFDPDRATLGGYLCVMTRSRALDRVRAGKRRARAVRRSAATDSDGFATPVSSFGNRTTARAERAELADALRDALAELPDEQRGALELAFFGGYTHTEIATETGLPLGTVKTRIRTAMQKLRGALVPFRPEAET